MCISFVKTKSKIGLGSVRCASHVRSAPLRTFVHHLLSCFGTYTGDSERRRQKEKLFHPSSPFVHHRLFCFGSHTGDSERLTKYPCCFGSCTGICWDGSRSLTWCVSHDAPVLFRQLYRSSVWTARTRSPPACWQTGNLFHFFHSFIFLFAAAQGNGRCASHVRSAPLRTFVHHLLSCFGTYTGDSERRRQKEKLFHPSSPFVHHRLFCFGSHTGDSERLTKYPCCFGSCTGICWDGSRSLTWCVSHDAPVLFRQLYRSSVWTARTRSPPGRRDRSGEGCLVCLQVIIYFNFQIHIF